MNNPQIYRASWHDYRSRCIYMVTFNKQQGVPAFSVLAGDWRKPVGASGSSSVVLSSIGTIIRDWILRLPQFDSVLKVLQYVIMPDHVHILLFVQQSTANHLGNTIARLKVAINNDSGMSEIFERGFNDQILNPGRSLNTIYRYIRENPRRLAVRRAHPEYFRRVNNLTIGNRCFQAYGNLQLIDNPFKEQVVVHRIDSPETREQHRSLWLYTVANGGVLVSPFISPAEKAIRTEAEEAGGKIILITHDPMDDRYKPAGHDFDRCEAGKLLIISANQPGPLLRNTCLAMNDLARTITLQ